MLASYYRPSGKSAIEFFLYYLLVMGVSLPILSNVYIYIVHFLPFVYINIVFTVGCGLLVGLMMNRIVKAGKCRNPLVVLILVLIAVCVLKYIQWCVYIPLVVSDVYGFPMTLGERFAESVFYFKRPGDVIVAARIVNEYGVWGFGKSRIVTGLALCIVWIFEFLIMICAAVVSSWDQPGRPFSEKSGAWYEEMKEKAEAGTPGDFASLVGGMENGVYAELLRLAAEGKTDRSNYLSLTFYQPPQGSVAEPYYLTIEEAVERKGKVKTKTRINYLAIDEKNVGSIINREAPGGDGLDVEETKITTGAETSDQPAAPTPLLDMDA